jgi:trehalose/maltose hydrolase-like predicted phosphorylase
MRRSAVCAAVLVFAVALGVGAAPAAAAISSPCPGDQGDTTTSGWALSTTTFDNAYTRHAYVGNGYLSQRVPATGTGYVETTQKTGWPLFTNAYDGAFVAGLYSKEPDPLIPPHDATIAAIPTWSTLKVAMGPDTYSATTPAGQISNFRQTLFLRCGVLRTSLTWTPRAGRATDLVYEVIAARNRPHVGAVRLTMTPHWNGPATVSDIIDGAGARRITQSGGGTVSGARTVNVAFRTATGTDGAVASTLTSGVAPSSVTSTATAQNLTASQGITFDASDGASYEFTKFVGVDTALTSSTPQQAAISASQQAASTGWAALLSGHAAAWDDLWSSDIVVNGRPELQEWIRSNLYALQSSIRAGDDNSIAPAGLSSDNYAGLIFWDAETWMYPSLLAFHPAVAESIIQYRQRTIPGARTNARKYKLKGLFFPWNGAYTGDLDECHSWDPPHCLTQIHLQGDIALSVWQYYLATGDRTWLSGHWTLLQGIAEFWAGRVTANADGSYSINNVAGPDEYSNGVNDGVFTNAGAALALRNATRAAAILGKQVPSQWTVIADHLRMPFDDQNQVFLQYDGYQGTQIKQADTVLLLYPLEWPMSTKVAAKTLDYYAPRTDPDGPAMTDAIHAVDAAQIGEPGCATHTYLMRSIRPFVRDPFAQYTEARGDKAGAQDPLAGSPAYNFLTGSGGFSQVFTFGLTGLRWREDRVHLDPMLPPQLSGGVTVKGLHWHGRTFDVQIGGSTTTVTLRSGGSFTLDTPAGTQTVSSSATIPTRRPDLLPPTDLARCRPATATSEEAGEYAEAAVDGSVATVWSPTASPASLTVDLGKATLVSSVVATWTDTKRTSTRILTSTDGTTWTEQRVNASGKLQTPVDARFVRVEVTSSASPLPGLRELEVR